MTTIWIAVYGLWAFAAGYCMARVVDIFAPKFTAHLLKREIHPAAVEALKAAIPEKTKEPVKTVKPYVRRQWSEDIPAKDSN